MAAHRPHDTPWLVRHAHHIACREQTHVQTQWPMPCKLAGLRISEQAAAAARSRWAVRHGGGAGGMHGSCRQVQWLVQIVRFRFRGRNPTGARSLGWAAPHSSRSVLGDRQVGITRSRVCEKS